MVSFLVRCNGPFSSKIAENYLTDCETGDSHFASKTTYQVVPVFIIFSVIYSAV